ncbi:MAG TPA: ACT domain-containing protein [Acidimicrobiales bacterium]|nr:ACT domain-containing protein [Acidimicrobiales bacterium]
MASFRLRVALPDRPGALGAVASRIGSVGGDVVSVDVVERFDESAVDEFIVELGDEARLGLLLSEVAEVDGVTVEEVHPLAGTGGDRRLDAYDTAVAVLRERTPQGVLTALAARVVTELDATWSAVLDVEDAIVIASAGRPPAAPWLVTYLGLARQPPVAPLAAAAPVVPLSRRPDAGDVGWVELAAWDLVLLVGRPGWRLGASDSARLEALARLTDARWVDLAERDARLSHPSCAG